MKAAKADPARQKPANPKPSNAGLADFLCFAIYSANLAYGRAYKPILEELGLTYTQYIAIVALWEQDNQTVGSLGEKLCILHHRFEGSANFCHTLRRHIRWCHQWPRQNGIGREELDGRSRVLRSRGARQQERL